MSIDRQRSIKLAEGLLYSVILLFELALKNIDLGPGC